MKIDPRTFSKKKKELNILNWKVKEVTQGKVYSMSIRPLVCGLILGSLSISLVLMFSNIESPSLLMAIFIFIFVTTMIFVERRHEGNPKERLDEVFKRLSSYEPVNMELYRALQTKVKDNLEDYPETLKLITEWIYLERKSVDSAFFGISNEAENFINKK